MEYSSGLGGERYYQQDIEYVLSLLDQGLTRDEIREIVLNENPFFVKTQVALQKRFQIIFKRSSSLTLELRKLYLNGTKYDKKALILYTILKTYRYAYENFYELIIYRYQQKNKKFVLGHLQSFMEEKEQQSKKVLKWSNISKKKVNNALLLFYIDSGMIELNEDVYCIKPLYVSVQLKNYAAKQDSLLHAMITLKAGVEIDDL